ncbi:unnamed protein product [Ceratitis capitata]|uniref:(Mediterranean fruit fly) hypothetical protein n=1 Tax=Ceratitis capitata TaxID=7213 RepID=A0A811V764_CERCA|nr:unnamed protein product [Ceratitis capitata]
MFSCCVCFADVALTVDVGVVPLTACTHIIYNNFVPTNTYIHKYMYCMVALVYAEPTADFSSTPMKNSSLYCTACNTQAQLSTSHLCMCVCKFSFTYIHMYTFSHAYVCTFEAKLIYTFPRHKFSLDFHTPHLFFCL